MKKGLFLLITGGCLLLAAAPAWAHHAFAAEFDANRPVKLHGTVTQWELVNPHSWIHMNVKNDDGSMTEWMIEVGSPNSLFRLGFTKNSLPPGTEVLVDGYQAKDRGNMAVGKNLTLPDGKRLFLGGSAGEVNGPAEKAEKK